MWKNAVVLSGLGAVMLVVGLGLSTGDSPGGGAGYTADAAPAVQAVRTTANGGCGSGCGLEGGAASSCCPGGAPAGPADPRRIRSVQSAIYERYARQLGDRAVQVAIEDFGCHLEATVSLGGRIVKRLAISGDTVSEIGGSQAG